jgi:hypothetical protein
MKDEEHKEDLTSEFDKALQKDITITQSQLGNVRLKDEDEDLWKRIKQSMRNIRRRRRRRR